MNKKLNLVIMFLLMLVLIYVNFNFSFKEVDKVSTHKEQRPLCNLILDNNNKPTQELIELLKIFNIDHDGSLKSIVDKTQEAFLRKPGKERWEIDDIDFNQETRSKVLQILEKLGLVNKLMPLNNKYDYVLVLGALGTTMTRRFAYSIDLWNLGIRFKNMIFLVGARPRDEKQETLESLIIDTKKYPTLTLKNNWKFDGNMPTTETEIMRFIYNQVLLPKEFMDAVIVDFVNTPMQVNSDGLLRRPNTGDTILELLKIHNIKGTILIISSNPYIGYQDSVVRTFMYSGFLIETVGPAANPKEKISIYLDTGARWLYQENIRRRISR